MTSLKSAAGSNPRKSRAKGNKRDDRSPGHDGDRSGDAAGSGSRGGRRSGRLFDYGELRLLVLTMLADQPSHGYEIIKQIKERFGGNYKPSPGVIYPTLTWLYDKNYAVIDTEGGGRKQYSITSEGKAFLKANEAQVKLLMSRVGPSGKGRPPAQIVNAMDHLKFALSLRMKREPLAESTLDKIAGVIDAAADEVEELMNERPVADTNVKSVAVVETPNAERFVRRLSSHFQHKTPVTAGENSVQIRMSRGACFLEAGEHELRVTVMSPDVKQMGELQEIIVRHLEDASVREELRFDWQSA